MRAGHAWVFVVTLIAAGSVGCSKTPQLGPPRLKTYPLTGTVFVDGKPAEAVMVQCVPEEGAEFTHVTSGLTDSEGKFAISSYVKEDGVPEGKYTLVFKWGRLPGERGRALAKLRGKLPRRYSDPKKSKFTVTVGKEKTDAGTIKLTTIGAKKS